MLLPGALLLFSLLASYLFAFISGLVPYVSRISPTRISCGAYGLVCNTQSDRILDAAQGG